MFWFLLNKIVHLKRYKLQSQKSNRKIISGILHFCESFEKINRITDSTSFGNRCITHPSMYQKYPDANMDREEGKKFMMRFKRAHLLTLFLFFKAFPETSRNDAVPMRQHSGQAVLSLRLLVFILNDKLLVSFYF